MSTVNYFEAPQTLVSTNARKMLYEEAGPELLSVMKGARLSYGAAVLLAITLIAAAFGFALVNIFWVLTLAAAVQTYGIVLLRKISPDSLALPRLTAALVLFVAGIVCMAVSQVLLHNLRFEAADWLAASLASWGLGGLALLLGLQRIGYYVNQPGVITNARISLVMLVLVYLSMGTYVFYISHLIDPALALTTMKLAMAVVLTLAVIGLVFYIRSVSVITRLAEIQLAQRASQMNFSELGEVEAAARGHEMDFLKM